MYRSYINMKYSKLFPAFFVAVFLIGCGNPPQIVQKDYTSEKMVLGTYQFTFDIHLENIGNSGKIYNLINDLIYDHNSFDEYIAYRENNFIGDTNEADYPPMIDEDGSESFYNSELIEKYSIIFHNDAYVLFEYQVYEYNSGAAHGNSVTRYFIIDVTEERLLAIDDLINPIPDDLLSGIIESNYGVSYYLRENVWPPDTVNFYNEHIELLWDTYALLPYSYGIIQIAVQDEIIEPYLTDKGKTLRKTTAGKK